MRFLTALVIFFFTATHGNALEIDYRLTNPGSDYPEYEITLFGEIIPGDAIAFETIARDTLQCFGQEIPCEVIMESPGGSLIEGLKIALILHENGLYTRVQSGTECSSACAFMFLGGTLMGVVGNRVASRTLEPFAQLGFHGFSVDEDRSEDVDLNQSLEMSRDLTALVFEVMLDIGNIDLNWLAQVMNVPSWSMYYAVSPYDLESISVRTSMPIFRPANWVQNLCVNAASNLNNYTDRETNGSLVQGEMTGQDFANWAVRNYDNGEQATNLMDMNAVLFGDFFDLPDAWETANFAHHELERGRGFYAEDCIVAQIPNGNGSFSYMASLGWGAAEFTYYGRFSPLPYLGPLWAPCTSHRTLATCENARWSPRTVEHQYNPDWAVETLLRGSTACSGSVELANYVTRIALSNGYFDIPGNFILSQELKDDGSYILKHSNCPEIQIAFQIEPIPNSPEASRQNEFQELNGSENIILDDYRPFSTRNQFWIFTGFTREGEFYNLRIYDDERVFSLEFTYPFEFSDLGSELVGAAACATQFRGFGLSC